LVATIAGTEAVCLLVSVLLLLLLACRQEQHKPPFSAGTASLYFPAYSQKQWQAQGLQLYESNDVLLLLQAYQLR
jgi:hypothetical protein